MAKRSKAAVSEAVVSATETAQSPEEQKNEQQQQQPQEVELYRPTIVEYQCYGRLTVKPSNNNEDKSTKQQMHEVNCDGYFYRQSSLAWSSQQHFYPTMTKDEALQTFTLENAPNASIPHHSNLDSSLGHHRNQNGFGGRSHQQLDNDDKKSSSNNAISSSLDKDSQKQGTKNNEKNDNDNDKEKTSSQSNKDTEIENHEGATAAPESQQKDHTSPLKKIKSGFTSNHIIDPKWIDLQSTIDDDDDYEDTNHHHHHRNQNNTTTPTTLPQGSNFAFYGSTNVSLLLLESTGQSRPISSSAITPSILHHHHSRGFPFHDSIFPPTSSSSMVPSPSSSEKQTQTPSSKEQHEDKLAHNKNENLLMFAISPEHRNGIAVRNIQYNNNNTSPTNHTTSYNGITTTETKRSMKTLKLGNLEVSMVTQNLTDTTTSPSASPTSANDNNNNKHQNENNNNQEEDEEEMTIENFTKTITNYIQKINTSSKKLETSMMNNATFLKNEFQDDFFNRTLKGSERVVDSFGKTLDRMSNLVVQVYKFWNDDDDDDSYDGGSGGY